MTAFQNFRLGPTDWVALTTYNGKDSEAVVALSLLGISAVSPQYSFWRRVPAHRRAKVGKGRELIQAPATPGYIYCQPEFSSQLPQILNVRAVHGIVRLGDCCRILDSEMRELLRVCSDSSDATDPAVRANLNPRSLIGKLVRFSFGPFEGMEGRVTGLDKRKPRVDLDKFTITARVDDLDEVVHAA